MVHGIEAFARTIVWADPVEATEWDASVPLSLSDAIAPSGSTSLKAPPIG